MTYAQTVVMTAEGIVRLSI